MTSFICAPFSVAPSKRIRRVSEFGGASVLSPCSRFTSTRTLVTCRMRNRGGFRLPPRVPLDSLERNRAIQLLGNLTQRKYMKPATRREIESLVGALPKSREIAQQWKVALQHTPNARLKHLQSPSAFKHRKEVMRKIRLPENSDIVGRCFILLGVLQRRYRQAQTPSTRVLQELEKHLGDYPVNVDDAHHFTKGLAQLQRERRSQELRPRRVSLESLEELHIARMLLGIFILHGSAGDQSEHLQELIGALPRNRNVAISWKKIISAAIRKKKRRDRTAARLAEIEHKRQERKLRREKRELEHRLGLPLPKDTDSPVTIDDREKVSVDVRKTVTIADRQPAEDREYAAVEGSGHTTAVSGKEKSFVARLQGMLARFFRGRR